MNTDRKYDISENKVYGFIGENILRRREELGIKPADMAQRLCISPEEYLDIENGVTDVNIDDLFRISKILRVNIAAFFPSLS